MPDTLCLDTPPSLPSGLYELRLVTEPGGMGQTISLGTIVISTGPPQPTICRLLTAPQIKRHYSGTDEDRTVTFLSLAMLQGYDVTLNDDLSGQITFRWQSLTNNPLSAQPRLRLIDDRGETVTQFSWIPVWGTHPTGYWFKDEVITDQVEFSLPPLAAGRYSLILEWQALSTGNILFTTRGQPYFVLMEFSK